MQKIFTFFFVSSLIALLSLGIFGTQQEADAGKGLGNGMRCTFNSDCLSNNCTFKQCKARGGSGKQLGAGMSCTFNSDCSSKNCTFKKCKGN